VENFICNQYGERLTVLNTENIKICGSVTKLEAIKYAICLRFLPHLQKIWIFIFPRQCSNLPKGRWTVLYQFCTEFHTLSSSVKSYRQSYRQLMVETFLRHSVVSAFKLSGWPLHDQGLAAWFATFHMNEWIFNGKESYLSCQIFSLLSAYVCCKYFCAVLGRTKRGWIGYK